MENRYGKKGRWETKIEILLINDEGKCSKTYQKTLWTTNIGNISFTLTLEKNCLLLSTRVLLMTVYKLYAIIMDLLRS